MYRRKYKTVIIGCGGIAGGYDANLKRGDWPLTHVGAFSAHDGFEVIACCDPDLDNRLAFQQRWKIPLGISYPEELAAHGLSVDVVSLCSPTVLHAQHLKTVLDWQPKLLFCEKPITPKIDETEYWIQQYKTAGILFLVNYSRRWDPDICILREDILGKRWGKIRSVSGTYNKGILNNGGHMIDLILYLLGSLRVIAAGKEIFDFWPDDPSVPALLETQDGIPVTLNIADAGDYALFELQIVTERGVLRMNDGGMNWSRQPVIDSKDFPGYRTLGQTTVQQGLYREAMTHAIAGINKVLNEGGDSPSTGATALEAQRICQQIRECSLKTF